MTSKTPQKKRAMKNKTVKKVKAIELKCGHSYFEPKKYGLTVVSRRELTREIREKCLELEIMLSELNKWTLPKTKK